MRFRTGDLVLDTDHKSVAVAGVPVRLTRKEFRILELLSLHHGVAVSRAALLDNLYGGADDRPEIRIIDVFVAVLRKKLADASRRRRSSYIVTVGDQGFKLSDPSALPPQA